MSWLLHLPYLRVLCGFLLTAKDAEDAKPLKIHHISYNNLKTAGHFSILVCAPIYNFCYSATLCIR